MSNIKEFYIEALVGFDIASLGDHGGGLTREDGAFILGFVFGPHAAQVEWSGAPGVHHGNGGYHTRYRLIIQGREAYNSKALDRLTWTLAKGTNAEIVQACWRDVQWNEDEPWYDCFQDEAEARIYYAEQDERIEQMMAGQTIKVVEHKADGTVEESEFTMPGHNESKADR